MKKQLANSFTARMGMAGALASAMLFGAPVHAQDSRLSLADRVSRLEQQQSQTQGGTQLVNQVQALQSQLQQMQGQIEELQHQVQEANDRNKLQAADADQRLSKLESAAAAAPAANPAPAAPAANIPPPPAASAAPVDAGKGGKTPPSAPASKGAATPAQAAYDEAYKSVLAGDNVKASRDFRAFIQQYPDSPLLPNAFYWLGESYYATTNYQVAMEAFQHLVSQYPQSDKTPGALLKVGYCQINLKQIDAGKATLKAVTAKYPGSSASGLAKDRLRQLQMQSIN